MNYLKNLIFICCYFHLFLLNAQQIEKQNKEVYGIKAGVNFAELLGADAIPESDRKIGYSFGVYGAFKLSNSLKLQTELIWSLQGEKSDKKGRYDISYLNIPILLKKNDGRFYYEFGPQIGLLTISTAKSVPEDIRLDNFDTFDFCLNMGVGFEVIEDWTIGIRYCHGLTNIIKNKDLKNSVLYLGIAHRIF